MPKNALVVGPPRSGTSLTARIFSAQNYFCGDVESDRHRSGDDFNPFGYFEADDVIERNVALFQRAGFEHHNTWLFEPISAESAARIAELDVQEEDRRLLEAYNRRAPWMWKDPRLCYTLGYWWKLMKPEETGVVLIRRDPEDVFRSFRRMGWSDSDADREQVTRRIIEHQQAARRTVEALKIPHINLDYAEFKGAPEEVARRFSEFFELELTAEDLNFRPELDHSTAGGRLTGHLRNLLKRLPRRPVRAVERMIPARVVALLFPERKYSAGKEAK